MNQRKADAVADISNDEWDELVERVTHDGLFYDHDLEDIVMAKLKISRAKAKRLIRNHDQQQKAELDRALKSGAKVEFISTIANEALKAKAKAKAKIN
jgi:hypothetical protein